MAIELVEIDINEAIIILSSLLYKRNPTEHDIEKIKEDIRILKR